MSPNLVYWGIVGVFQWDPICFFPLDIFWAETKKIRMRKKFTWGTHIVDLPGDNTSHDVWSLIDVERNWPLIFNLDKISPSSLNYGDGHASELDHISPIRTWVTQCERDRCEWSVWESGGLWMWLMVSSAHSCKDSHTPGAQMSGAVEVHRFRGNSHFETFLLRDIVWIHWPTVDHH